MQQQSEKSSKAEAHTQCRQVELHRASSNPVISSRLQTSRRFSISIVCHKPKPRSRLPNSKLRGVSCARQTRGLFTLAPHPGFEFIESVCKWARIRDHVVVSNRRNT